LEKNKRKGGGAKDMLKIKRKGAKNMLKIKREAQERKKYVIKINCVHVAPWRLCV
jgi:hypothetical protein